MKRLLLFTSVIAFVAVSASGQTPVTAQAQWAEKNAFHTVMAQTFHPSEEGNFEPIRSRIGEMYEKALAWANSTPPKEYDKPEIRSAIKEMLGQIIALKGMIERKATNEDIKPKLEELHETFHKIIGMCAKDDGSDEHHPHDVAQPKEHKE